MCKLAGWSTVPGRTLDKNYADAGLQAAHRVISKTERDGFGFAQPKSLRGRFRYPEGFQGITALPDLVDRAGKAASAFAVTKDARQAGRYSPSQPMVIHGRTATTAVTLDNVHPFVHRGWVLAHNGVVNWEGEMTGGHEKVTCDSQHILLALAEGPRPKPRLEKLTGYAAFIAFAPDGRMIVARDARASLFAAILPSGRWVFGTTQEIAEEIGSEFTTKEVNAFKLDDFTWLEFRPNGYEPKVFSWKLGEATERENRFAKRSLGETTPARPPGPATMRAKLGDSRFSVDSNFQDFPEDRGLHVDANRLLWEKVNTARWVCLGENLDSGLPRSVSHDSAGETFRANAPIGELHVDRNLVTWTRLCDGVWQVTPRKS